MKSGLFVFIHFVCYTIFLIIFELFYPEIDLVPNLEVLDVLLIRFLSSYCYYAFLTSFWVHLVIHSILFVFILSFLIIKFPNQLKRFCIQWAGLYGIFHYLFWIFAENPRNQENIPNIPLQSNFLILYLIFFSINLGICLLFLILTKFRKKNLGSRTEKKQLPSTIFECPHCSTKFYSHIQYCSACKKKIQEKSELNESIEK